MKKFYLVITMVLTLLLLTSGSAFSFFIDFENGIDGNSVSDIVGVSFQDFNGYDALYADIRTGKYNATSDDLGISTGSGAYHHNGNFAVWAGPNADARGITVDFTNNDGTWFTTGYASYSNFYVEAYLTDGSMVSVSGGSNLNGPMGSLTVNATAGTYIDYLILHDSGNYWIVDDMSGDASGVNVPEPAAMLLFGTGILGIVGISRKRRFK